MLGHHCSGTDYVGCAGTTSTPTSTLGTRESYSSSGQEYSFFGQANCTSEDRCVGTDKDYADTAASSCQDKGDQGN
jgi:hypothetical protein